MGLLLTLNPGRFWTVKSIWLRLGFCWLEGTKRGVTYVGPIHLMCHLVLEVKLVLKKLIPYKYWRSFKAIALKVGSLATESWKVFESSAVWQKKEE